MPTLGEFIERAKRFGVRRKHTPKIADGPRGAVRFYYLQRRAGEPFVVLDDMPDNARLTPNQVRSYCRVLGLPPEDFGLDAEDR
jgi:hypothetical protein